MVSTQDFAHEVWQSLENIRDRLAVLETEVRHSRRDFLPFSRDVAGDRLTRKKGRKTRLTLTLPNGDKNNLIQMVHRVLSDRIKVVYSDMGIDEDFFIEHMELDAVARTGEVTTRWLVQGA